MNLYSGKYIFQNIPPGGGGIWKDSPWGKKLKKTKKEKRKKKEKKEGKKEGQRGKKEEKWGKFMKTWGKTTFSNIFSPNTFKFPYFFPIMTIYI